MNNTQENQNLDDFRNLVRDSNIEYNALLLHCRNQGISSIELIRYIRIRQGVAVEKSFERAMWLIHRRKLIRMAANNHVTPLISHEIGIGEMIGEDDDILARRLHQQFGTIETFR